MWKSEWNWISQIFFVRSDFDSPPIRADYFNGVEHRFYFSRIQSGYFSSNRNRLEWTLDWIAIPGGGGPWREAVGVGEGDLGEWWLVVA